MWRMNDPLPLSERQDAILNAAFHAFATYGFRRTTMDDIATGAGLSRTALYLHYRNKEDLFRQLTLRFFAEVNQALTPILGDPQADPVEVLTAAFIAKDGKFMDAVLGTPHGSELMDAGFSIAGDIAAEGEAQFLAQLTAWLARRSLPPDLGDARQLATTLMASLKGIKSSSRNLAEYRAAQSSLARVFGRALQG